MGPGIILAWHCGDLMDFCAVSRGPQDPRMGQDGGIPEIQGAVLEMLCRGAQPTAEGRGTK